jgi:hypothetical protein
MTKLNPNKTLKKVLKYKLPASTSRRMGEERRAVDIKRMVIGKAYLFYSIKKELLVLGI